MDETDSVNGNGSDRMIGKGGVGWSVKSDD